MKKPLHTLFIVVAALAVCSAATHAMPIGSSNIPFDYMVKGQDLSIIRLGLYGISTKREIKWDGTGVTQILKSKRSQGYLGVDLMPWLTVYGIAGQSESKFGTQPYGNAESSLGAGVLINVLHHFIHEPVLMEDVVRINLGAEWTRSSADTSFSSADWDEVAIALTFALINHVDTSKLFHPESIGLYIGPLYSRYISDDFEAKDEIGVVAGMEIFFTDTVSLDFEAQHFSETSAAGGINFHF
jgi:hypothetical protein